MGVQWQGPAASAAAAALERHVRGLDDRGKWRPSPVHHAIGTGVSVLLPWLVFMFAAALLVIAYEERATTVWGLIGGVGGLCALLALGGIASGRMALTVLGLWSLTSMSFGVFMGRYVNTEYMQIYWRIRSAGPGLVGVDPAAAEVASLGDEAAIITFTDGTIVDDRRTIGYVAKGNIYCVAPVMRRAKPSAPVEFWAAGIGCCERRSNFDCGSARLSGSSLTALSYTASGDKYFAEAVKEAASVYNIKIGEHAQRVFFEGDPATFVDDLWREAVVAAILAAVFHLCTCIIVSTALQKAGIRWVGGFGGQPSAEDLATEDILLRGGAARGKDKALTSNQVRTILDPRASWVDEKPERSCLGCGPRSYWVWRSPEDQQMEEIEKQIWYSESRRLDVGSDPSFFDRVIIAEDGGFNEVPQLMKNVSWYRYFSAYLTVGLIVFNIAYILKSDANMISATSGGSEMYLISETLIKPPASFLLRIVGIEGTISFRANVVVPVMEICCLVFVLSWVTMLSVEAALAEPRGRRRWKNLSRAFFNFPAPLAGFSAMSLLHYVSPPILIEQVMDYSHRRATVEPVRAWLKFILIRFVALVIGVDAFLMKFRMTSQYINQEAASAQRLAQAAGFILQLLGIVQVSVVVRERLLRAFFGGEDATEDVEEKAKEDAYHSLLAREMYRHSQSDTDFVVMMLSFNDADFQGLMLNMSNGSRMSSRTGQEGKNGSPGKNGSRSPERKSDAEPRADSVEDLMTQFEEVAREATVPQRTASRRINFR